MTGPEHDLIKPFNKQSDKRFLVVCRASDHSLHKEWLSPGPYKNFDLLIEYYGAQHGIYADDCEIYSEAQGIKWGRFHRLIERYGESFFRYDAVWFPDDDIRTDSRNINKMFDIFTEYKLELAQGALDPGSHIVWPIERQEPQYKLRYTNFVHIMAPMFSRNALQRCWRTFGESQIGLGLDFLWPKLLGYPREQIAIIDDCPVEHTRRAGGGTIIADCAPLSIDPMKEYEQITRDYDIKLYHPAAYGVIFKEDGRKLMFEQEKIYYA